MKNYFLNGKNLKTAYGITALQAEGSNLAISGAWDFPVRTGKCFHDWGDDDGIEPYVSAEEIRFAGRDIVFVGMVSAATEKQALVSCYKLYNDIGGFNSLVPFEAEGLGKWMVIVKSEIKAEYIGSGYCKITITFREPVCDLSGILPTNKLEYNPVTDHLDNPIYINNQPLHIGSINFDGYGIDGVMFRNLGLIILDFTGHFGRPAAKDGEYTSYQNEGFKITRHSAREITMKALIVQPGYEAFKAALKGLYKLFSKEGLRYITKENDFLRDFFVKDGFAVSDVNIEAKRVVAVLEMKLTEAKAWQNWSILTDANNNEIVTELGNIIIT